MKTIDPFKPENLVLSPTQLEMADLCRRKRWFRYVAKMPMEQQYYLGFGEVLHAVLARWLEADDQGSGPDLYPKDWERPKSRFSEDLGDPISRADQHKIKRLVHRAADQGVIQRIPGRAMEEHFILVLVEYENATKERPNIYIQGYIDLLSERLRVVEDHKSSKNDRYVKGPVALANSIQMNVYARALIDRLEEKISGCLEPRTSITLAHNYFIKEDEKVKRSSVEVTARHVEDRFEGIYDLSCEVAEDRNLENWGEVPGPALGSRACQAFGGCPFQGICSLTETVDQYKERVSRITKEKKKELPMAVPKWMQQARAARKTNQSPENEESFAQRIKARAAEIEKERKLAPVLAAKRTPPWHNPKCTACEKIPGFGEGGDPCRICAGFLEERPSPDLYDITWSLTDEPTWSLKKDMEEIKHEPPEAMKKEEAPKKKKRGRPKGSKSKKTKEKEKAMDEAEEPPYPPLPAAGLEPESKEEGFILLIGCYPTKAAKVVPVSVPIEDPRPDEGASTQHFDGSCLVIQKGERNTRYGKFLEERAKIVIVAP